MEGKAAFILHADLIHTLKHLSIEQRGKLFTTILEYVNDQDPDPQDQVIAIAFEPIKRHLKRDLQKWKDRKERNSANAKKRWENIQPHATASEGKEPHAKNAVKVKDKDRVKDKEKVKDKEITLLVESATHADVPPEHLEYLEIAQAFHKLIISNLEEAGASTKKTAGAKLKTWLDPIRLMVEQDGVTKEQFLKMWRTIKTNAFWKKNILSTAKLREQQEKLILEANNGTKGQNKQPGISDKFAREILAGETSN